MYVGRLFQNNPLEALAILLCLATILYCSSLIYRHRDQHDRFLVSLLGFIAMYQILRVVKDAGFIFWQIRGFDVTMNLLVSSMCLAAAMILRISCADRNTTKVQLRLVEANEKTVGVKSPAAPAAADLSAAMVEASPLAMFTVDAIGIVNSWNGAAEQLLGWKRKEVLGSHPPVSVTGEGLQRLKHRDGREIGATAWTAPLRAAGSGARGSLIVLAALADAHDAVPGLLASIGK